MNAWTLRGYDTDPIPAWLEPCGNRVGAVPLGPAVPRAHAPTATGPGGSSVELAARDALVGVDVLLAGLCHDVLGQLGTGRGVVPARLVEPVAHVLLVEAVLGAPRLVVVGR